MVEQGDTAPKTGQDMFNNKAIADMKENYVANEARLEHANALQQEQINELQATF